MINILISSENMWLTQKGDISDELRSFHKKAVGTKATPEYWEEWSEDKKVAWEEAHKPIEPIIEQ